MRRFLIAWFALLCSVASALAAQTIDGTQTGGSNGVTGIANSVGLTTASTNDIIVVIVAAERTNAQGSLATVSSITDNQGSPLTYTKRSAFSFQNASHGTPFIDLEVWYAVAASTLSNVTITATLSVAADNASIIVFGVTSSNTSTPWDTASGSSGSCTVGTANGFCAQTSSTGTPSVAGVSTACDKTMIVQAAYAAANDVDPTDLTAGTGFTIVANKDQSGGTNFSKVAAQQNVVAATQSSITTAFAAASWPGYITIMNALQDATATCGASANPPGLMLLGVGQ